MNNDNFKVENMRKFYNIDPRIHFEKLDELFDQPEIIRVTDFEEEDLKEFELDFDAAHNTGQPVIPIVIDSFGGCGYGLLGMIAAIEQSKIPVATIITSKAMSAGSLLFCFGTEGYRYMHPDAQMMIHDAATAFRGKLEDLKAETKHLGHLNELVYKKACKHLGHSPNYMTDLIKKQNHIDWFLTAKEAKRHKIVNHLRVPSFEIKVSLNISFE